MDITITRTLTNNKWIGKWTKMTTSSLFYSVQTFSLQILMLKTGLPTQRKTHIFA
jgi:hypothetical protein